MVERMTSCVKQITGDCGRCPIVLIADRELQARRTEPIRKVLLDVAAVHCPDGMSPTVVRMVALNGRHAAGVVAGEVQLRKHGLGI